MGGKVLLRPLPPAANKIAGPGGIWKYDPEYQKHHHHHPHGQEDAMYDENPSDEQDAMNEVSGIPKDLLEKTKKIVGPGGIWKYDPEYQKHHHHHPHGQED